MRFIDDSERKASLDDIAFIGIPFQEFIERYAIPFSENTRYEAPGPMAYAPLIELDSGRQVSFYHYYDYPEAGVWLVGDPKADLDQQLDEVVDALSLDPETIRWVRYREQWVDNQTRSQPWV